MANEYRGEIPVEFRGKPLTLRLTTNAMAQIEGAERKRVLREAFENGWPADFQTPRKVPAILEAMSSEDSAAFEDIRLFFWGMMLEALPQSTLDDAAALVDELKGQEQTILGRAVDLAFPEPEGGSAGK